MALQDGVSIAESVLGASLAMGPGEGFQTAYENLMGAQLSVDQLRLNTQLLTTLSDIGASPFLMSAEEIEELITVNCLLEIFAQEEIKNANNLVDWPSYQSMMEAHGQKIGGTALLIGSISPLSSRAFEVLATEVYEADQAVVIDIEGSRKKAAGANFVLGSGTELPFASGSMNYVHTSRLLHMLEEPNTRHTRPKHAVRRLFSEIGRVLALQGQLFMQETVPGEGSLGARDTKRFSHKIRQSLGLAGLEHVVITPTVAPATPDFLFDPSRDFSVYPTNQLRGVIDIFARKLSTP